MSISVGCLLSGVVGIESGTESVRSLMSYRFKKGVEIRGVRTEMAGAWGAVASAYAEFGYECVITSVCDSEHKSLVHILGMASDFRIRHVRVGWHEKLAKRIGECLTDEFDVVLEDDHIHVEFDPR